MQQLTDIANSIISFINTVAVPLVFAVAFIVFLFGVFRYFIAGAAKPEKRKEGTQLILYSIIGFAVMIVVWGLVNLVVGTFGFKDTSRPNLPTFGNTNSSGTGSNLLSPDTTQFLDQQSKIETQTQAQPTQGYVGPPAP